MIDGSERKNNLTFNNTTLLTVLDIGCRWGFADKFIHDMEDMVIYGFDPDEEECERLEELYNHKNIILIPIALSNKPGKNILYLTKEPACSSLYMPNKELTKNYPALDCARKVSQMEIEVSTLNQWVKEAGISRVDYIKIDTQGAELNILMGASDILQEVRFLEIEVEFNSIYDGQPIFSEVDCFLRKYGFVLWKLSNLVCYAKEGESDIVLANNSINYDHHRFEYPVRGGQIYWADAFYIQKNIVDVKYDEHSNEQIKRDSNMANRLGFLDLKARLDKELNQRLGR